MKEFLNSEERGILVFLIEEYFKTTHAFRCHNEVTRFSKAGILINPYSYVNFINTFDLSNILNGKKFVHTSTPREKSNNTGHTGIDEKWTGENAVFNRIPNFGFPEISGSKITTKGIQDYIKKGDLKEIQKIDANGKEQHYEVKSIETVMEKIKNVFQIFDTKKCNITWNHNKNAWFFVNFFPSVNYRNKEYIKNGKFVSPTKNIVVTTDVKPFIRIFSNKKEGCTMHGIGKSFKFKIGNASKSGKSGCKHCFGKKTKLKKTGLTLKMINRDLKYLRSF